MEFSQVENLMRRMPFIRPANAREPVEMSVTKVIRAAVDRLSGKKPKSGFTNSADYWESRYRAGGNSGAGSYNRLAQFKADFLNNFVQEYEVQSVIEFGSGDGAQLRLAEYPCYSGVDVSWTAVHNCREEFSCRPGFRFFHQSEVTRGPFRLFSRWRNRAGPPHPFRAELSLSLDVIYHLVEDRTYHAYMRQIFDAAERFVIIYASNEEKLARVAHVRHRKFTDWVETNRPDFSLIRHVPNPYPFDEADPANTSFADFYVFERVQRC